MTQIFVTETMNGGPILIGKFESDNLIELLEVMIKRRYYHIKTRNVENVDTKVAIFFPQ